ncbi:MAG: PaREP1 family protein, partial [Candidatus Methanospirareceae archaeon]
ASEKLWGASALAVKRIGAEKGLKLEEHGGLWSFVNLLAMQSGDKDLTTLFHVANSLHRNFYEDEMKRETVEIAAKNIEQLITKLMRFS